MGGSASDDPAVNETAVNDNCDNNGADHNDDRFTASRIDAIWLALPYVLVVVGAVLTWAEGLAPDRLPELVIGCVAVLGWHTWFVVAHRAWFATRALPMIIYFLGLIALTAYLFHLTFNFLPLYLCSFALAFVALPGGWAYAGVGLATAVALLGPNLLTWSPQNVVVTLAGGGLAAIAGGSIRTLEAETARRQTAVRRLALAHADLERALADNVALRDRLIIEARQGGIAAERSRLAGEIHDTLAGGLAGIVSQLEALDAGLEPDHPLRHRVVTGVAVAQETLREARRSVRDLRPGLLDEHPLPVAVGELAAQIEQHYGLPIAVHIDVTDADLPLNVEDVLLRAAREALTNVVRHAHAEHAHISVSGRPGWVALDVADDGGGLATPVVDAARNTGHGLAIMRSRVQAVGGDVVLESSPGQGTVLTVNITFDPPPRFDGLRHGPE